MRHCGRSGLSVCVSVCVSAGVKDTDKVCTTSKSAECRQWSRGAAHCWTLDPGWTCASVNPPIVHLHLAKTDGSSTHAVTCPIPRVRARGRSHGWQANIPQLRVWRAGLKRPCPSPAPSVICVIPARRSRGGADAGTQREDRESLFGFVKSLIFSSLNRARSPTLGMVHLSRCCRRLVALF